MLNAAHFGRFSAVGVDKENVAAGCAARKDDQPAALRRPRHSVQVDADLNLGDALRRRLALVHAIDERCFVA